MIATFGSGHVHPDTGESLAQRFVRVEGPDEDAIRLVLNDRFGGRWASLYADETAAGVGTYGLTEVDLPTVGRLTPETLADWLATNPDEAARFQRFGALCEDIGRERASIMWHGAQRRVRERASGTSA